MFQFFFSLRRGLRSRVAVLFLGLGLLLLAVPLFFPMRSRAAGLVDLPCGADGRCQVCDLVSVGNNLINFAIIDLAMPLAALSFAWAGLLYITSGGGPQAAQAHRIFFKVLWGLLFVLGGWLIVHTIIQVFVTNKSYLPWNEIACEEQPKFIPPPDLVCPAGDDVLFVDGENICSSDFKAKLAAGEGSSPSLPPPQGGSTCSAAAAAPYAGLIAGAASDNGLNPIFLRSFLATESSFRPDPPLNGFGVYGMGQMKPDTARGTKLPEFANKNDSEIIALLKQPPIAIKASAKYLAQLSADPRINGNERRISAGYIGGARANLPSTKCPGQTWWECEKNPGYAAARAYVPQIQANKVCT